jgi:hypothetical protein
VVLHEGHRFLFWKLCAHKDIGGMGMSPSSAGQLTIEQAIFCLADERTIKASCRSMNRFFKPQTVDDYKTQLAKLRERFTGSAEASLSEKELASIGRASEAAASRPSRQLRRG